jgi:hypothetical protein
MCLFLPSEAGIALMQKYLGVLGKYPARSALVWYLGGKEMLTDGVNLARLGGKILAKSNEKPSVAHRSPQPSPQVATTDGCAWESF